MKFRLLAGKHTQRGPDGRPISFRQGDVVESKRDLCAMFNYEPHSRKFERLEEDVAASKGVALGDPKPPSRNQPPVPPTPPAVVHDAAKRGFDGGEQATATLPAINTDTLDHMSVKDLQALAAAEEIDLRGASKKEDIIKVIRAAVAE